MTREEELARLVAEQEADDTPMCAPERAGDTSFQANPGLANMLAYDEAGEPISFVKHEKGTILVGGADWHGTTGGYNNHKCRCDRCTQAFKEYRRKKRADS